MPGDIPALLSIFFPNQMPRILKMLA
jgi:hypothetical protein